MTFTRFTEPPPTARLVDGQLVLMIPGRPPTPNNRFGNVYAERSAAKRWRRTAWAIGVDAVNRSGWKAPARARITLTFIVPDNRPRDIDNLVASTKPLTDGLVDAKVLVGDKSTVLEWGAPRTEVIKGSAATVYVIEVVVPPPPTLGL